MPTYTITTEGLEGVTTATETILQLKGVTSDKAHLVAWGISFSGIDPVGAPIQVDLLRQTTAGTNSGAAEVPLDADEGTPGVTGFTSFTVEPTAGAVLEQYWIHPQGGMLIREYPPGREPTIAKSASDYLGLRVVTPGAAVNVLAWMQWEE